MSIEQGTQAPKEPQVTENTDGSAVIYDDGASDTKPAGGTAAVAESDDRVRSGGADEGSDAGDTGDAAAEAAELAAAGTDAEREEIRKRRREERHNRKIARKNREDDLRKQIDAQNRVIDDMRGQLDVINRRSSGADLAQVDERINQAQANITYLEGVIADGTKAQNGEAVARATVELQKQLLGKDKLETFKARMTEARQRPEAPQLDPRTVQNARTWFNENKWYDPKGGDADSRVVLALDNQLAAEGYNPATSAYWEELTERVRAVLPRHFEDPRGGHADDDTTNAGGGQSSDRGYNAGTSQRKPTRSVVTGGSSAAAGSGGGKGGYVLSPDRVAALKEAGIWNDPQARAEAIRRYKDYDAQATRGSN